MPGVTFFLFENTMEWRQEDPTNQNVFESGTYSATDVTMFTLSNSCGCYDCHELQNTTEPHQRVPSCIGTVNQGSSSSRKFLRIPCTVFPRLPSRQPFMLRTKKLDGTELRDEQLYVDSSSQACEAIVSMRAPRILQSSQSYKYDELSYSELYGHE